MTQLPNIITLLRMAGSLGLLFCDATGVAIWSIIPISIAAIVATFAAIHEGMQLFPSSLRLTNRE